MPRQRVAALHDARRVEHARECTLGYVAATLRKLAEIDALGEREFVARLGAVFEHSPWVAERTWKKKPFRSVDKLHEAMMESVMNATQDEQLALVCAHPELAGREANTGTLTSGSSSEQGRLGFTSLAPDEFRQMQDINRRYRQKFGFPCIVALKLHASRGSVVAEMERRLANDAAAELKNALAQIGHIALGRLQRMVS